MQEKKIVRQSNARKTPTDKLKEALAKKPTASYLNAQGIPAEGLKQFGNLPESKQKLIQQRNVRNPKNRKRFQNRPAAAGPNIVHNSFEAPTYRVFDTPEWFNLPEDQQVDVSIIVPLYKSKEKIKEQIASWDLSDDGLKKEIIYVDDFCPEKSYQGVLDAWELRKENIQGIGKIILNNRNGGYSFSNNTGAKHAKGRFLIFLNADTTVTKGWVRGMYDEFNAPEIGIVGNLHLKKDGTIDSCGSEWDWHSGQFAHVGKHIYQKKPLPRAFHINNAPKELLVTHEVEMVTGACFMIPALVFREVKGFDTEYRIAYWEDADLCMKVHAFGYKVIWTPHSTIYHSGGHSQAGMHTYMTENRRLFHSRWVETKIVHGYLNENRPEVKRLEIPNEKIVVYTAITGMYDNLKEQPLSARDVDFVAYLENPPEESNTWQLKPLQKHCDDPCRNAKIYKILPHKYFPDKEYSLWIDGSVKIDFPFSIARLIELYLGDTDIALFKHSERNCLYQEAQACIQRNLDDPDLIRKQINRYTKEGYPSNNGLAECTVLLRRHTPQIKRFIEMWWDEIRAGLKRDQISFNFFAKKLGLQIRFFPGHLRKRNYLFDRDKHKGSRR